MWILVRLNGGYLVHSLPNTHLEVIFIQEAGNGVRINDPIVEIRVSGQIVTFSLNLESTGIFHLRIDKNILKVKNLNNFSDKFLSNSKFKHHFDQLLNFQLKLVILTMNFKVQVSTVNIQDQMGLTTTISIKFQSVMVHGDITVSDLPIHMAPYSLIIISSTFQEITSTELLEQSFTELLAKMVRCMFSMCTTSPTRFWRRQQ